MRPSPSDEKFDAYKETEHARAVYKAYRDYEEHENTLLNQRVTWLITMQAVTLATFGFSIQKQYELAQKIRELWSHLPVPDSAKVVSYVPPELEVYDVRFAVLLTGLALVGMASAITSLIGIIAAKTAQEELRERWRKHHSETAQILKLPNIAGGGSPRAERHGATFASAIPCFFFAIWAGALGYIACVVWQHLMR